MRTALALTLLATTAHAERLSDDDLARKSEDGHVTGLPLAAYSVDFGFGGGARAYYYWNGKRSDSRFAETPYLHRVFAQAFASTEGVQFHWLDYDGPRIAGSPYRPRVQLIYARNTNANYFGFTERDRTLRHPGTGQTFDDYDEYVDDLSVIRDGFYVWTKYNQYDIKRPALIASLERSFRGDRVRVLTGVGASFVQIRDYTRTEDEGKGGVIGLQAATRLFEGCDQGPLVGCRGGRDNYLRFGIAYDTRDFEPDPNRGVFIDAELDIGTTVVGSEFNYARILAAARGFWSPFARDIVLAGRVMAVVQSDGTPFFTMNVLPFTEDPRTGLGGHRTMRGFRQDRFVDHVMTAASGEVRWTFARTTVKRQKLAFIVAPFVDVGRSFDDFDALSLRGFRPSTGAAFRVSWNLSTIGTFEYGISRESTGFYANFGHMF